MMYYPSKVSRFAYLSEDQHHKLTHSQTAVSLSCKYAKKDQVIKDKNGKDILTVAWLQFPLTQPSGIRTTILRKDKIVLPDGTTAPIADVPRVIHYPHNGKEMCIEAYLGKEAI